jgi:3-oxoacyl-[acyl-carrier protein] reductase
MPPTATALVTGATQGIGRATAFALGRAGYRVGVCARTPAAVDELVAALTKDGTEAAGTCADVGDPRQAPPAVDRIVSALGEIDVLVNNAGMFVGRPLEEITVDEWDAVMATNVRSLFLMSQAVLPGMRRRREGSIVNVASLAGRNGFVGGTAYVASKHAVLGFSRALMLEVRKDNVRVIAVCPGSVDTGMIRDQPMLRSDPARILRPEDVADTIVSALRLPARAMVSELDVRPTNP